MLIEEVSSVEPPRGKILIEEISQSWSSAKNTAQSNSSLLACDEEPDDQSHPLIQETSQAKTVDHSEDGTSMTSSGAANRIPLIEEISDLTVKPTETASKQQNIIKELKEFGACIPNSWEVVENGKKISEQEETDETKGENRTIKCLLMFVHSSFPSCHVMTSPNPQI